MDKCTHIGCDKEARWEIEIMQIPPTSKLYYACDEHSPDPAILDPVVDSIRRIKSHRKEGS